MGSGPVLILQAHIAEIEANLGVWVISIDVKALIVLRLILGIMVSTMSELAVKKMQDFHPIIHPLSYPRTSLFRHEKILEAPDNISKRLFVLFSWQNALFDPAWKLA